MVHLAVGVLIRGGAVSRTLPGITRLASVPNDRVLMVPSTLRRRVVLGLTRCLTKVLSPLSRSNARATSDGLRNA